MTILMLVMFVYFSGDHTEAIEIHYDPENVKYEGKRFLS